MKLGIFSLFLMFSSDESWDSMRLEFRIGFHGVVFGKHDFFFDDTMGIDSGFIFTKLVKYHEILTEFQKDVPFR